jgi:hypothetical protein
MLAETVVSGNDINIPKCSVFTCCLLSCWLMSSLMLSFPQIPNFFHLTPLHIKKHCEALKRE